MPSTVYLGFLTEPSAVASLPVKLKTITFIKKDKSSTTIELNKPLDLAGFSPDFIGRIQLPSGTYQKIALTLDLSETRPQVFNQEETAWIQPFMVSSEYSVIPEQMDEITLEIALPAPKLLISGQDALWQLSFDGIRSLSLNHQDEGVIEFFPIFRLNVVKDLMISGKLESFSEMGLIVSIDDDQHIISAPDIHLNGKAVSALDKEDVGSNVQVIASQLPDNTLAFDPVVHVIDSARVDGWLAG